MGDEEEAGGEARERYADLLESITSERPESAALAELSAYEMAASIEIDLDVKQGLLELRSEEERLRLLARLFKAGIKRVELARNIADRAAKNGKVKFGRAQSTTTSQTHATPPPARVARSRQLARDGIAARGLRAAEEQVEPLPADEPVAPPLQLVERGRAEAGLHVHRAGLEVHAAAAHRLGDVHVVVDDVADHLQDRRAQPVRSRAADGQLDLAVAQHEGRRHHARHARAGRERVEPARGSGPPPRACC